ncbi:hypothetical protein PC118_g7744 [Phytophthora cactorum]|uniref:Uncharacterized protein n=1 Tax=Phytophthora cactorum TaxID=29920 RepID=A0A8T1G8E1_9STRA|nr:hypothetical protein PC118_g7744 [Phytophthora cactorum]
MLWSRKLTPKVTQTSVYAEADYSLRVEKTLGRSKKPSQLVREIGLSSCSSSDGETSTGGIGTEVTQIANAHKDQKLSWNAE